MRLKASQILGGEAPDEGAEPDYCVLADDHLGEEIARRLQADGHTVRLISETQGSTEIPGTQGDPGDVRVLEEAGVSEASTVIVATPRDGRNLLLAQIVKVHFDVSDVLVLANAPDQHDLVAEAGHESICATTSLVDTLVDELEARATDLDQTA
jgi:Trk K+ transport system NAD-binding subunit